MQFKVMPRTGCSLKSCPGPLEILEKLKTKSSTLKKATSMETTTDTNNQSTNQSVNKSTIEFDVSRGQTMNDLFALLSQHSIRVSSLRNKSNRLEELFIHLVTENRAQ